AQPIVLDSTKLGRQVLCESISEYQVFVWLERAPEVCWYQEQPIAVPYVLRGRNRYYFPDVAALDGQGRFVVVEVKPIFDMYREHTLAKALACLKYAEERGMGYLLIDSRGRTLADYSALPYNLEV